MGILKNIFGFHAEERARTRILKEIVELEGLFVGEILENPSTTEADVDTYKDMCFARCEQYQEAIQTKKEAIEKILHKSDTSMPCKKTKAIHTFMEKTVDCARETADKFHEILNKGIGKDKKTKRKLNEETYVYSIKARKKFRREVRKLLSMI